MLRILLLIQFLLVLLWLTGFISALALPFVVGIDVAIVAGAIVKSGNRPLFASLFSGAVGYSLINALTITIWIGINNLTFLDFVVITLRSFLPGMLFVGIPGVLGTYIIREVRRGWKEREKKEKGTS